MCQCGEQVGNLSDYPAPGRAKWAGKVRAVIFDLGDTLIHGNFTAGATEEVWDEIYCRLINPAAAPHIPPLADLRRAWRDYVQVAMARTWREKTELELDFLPLIQSAFQAAGMPQAGDTSFLRQVVALEHSLLYDRVVQVAPDAIATLTELKRRGYRLGMVSNFCNLPEVAYENIRRIRLLDLFDHTILSCEVGFRKPSPRIYDFICQRLAVEARSCLFVGDRLVEDVAGPQRAGMFAVQSTQFRHEEEPATILPDAVILTLSGLLDLL